MSVEIPSEFADFVRRAIEEGPFRTEAEVVGEALRQFEQRRQRIEELKQEIGPALDRLDRGEGLQLDDASLGEFFANAKVRGRQKWEAERDAT